MPPFDVAPNEAQQLAALFIPGAAWQATKRLVSYSDVNWLMREAATKRSYLLKVHNAEDSGGGLEQLQAHTAAMRCVAGAGITTSEPVAAPDGSDILLQRLPGTGDTHAVRLLTFVPGEVMGTRAQPREVQDSWGYCMGRVSAALRAFDHPALHVGHDWSMGWAAATIRERAPLVDRFSQPQKARLLAAAARLDEVTGACPLPCQVCHADANELNLLVDDSRTQVVGVLDFGDACYCWRASEVAIAMLYAMLLPPLPGEGPLAAGARVLAGFERSCPLEAAERAALPALVATRLALSLTNGAFSAQLHPSNSEYLLQTQGPGWGLLGVLEWMGEERVLRALVPADARVGTHDGPSSPVQQRP